MKPKSIKEARAQAINRGLLLDLATTYTYHAAYAKAKKKLRAIVAQRHAEKVSRGV